jgi:hypothetical protein
MVFRSAGFNAEQTAAALQDVYQADGHLAARALQSAGFGASGVARGLEATYGHANTASVQILRQWFGADEIAVALKDVYLNTAAESTGVLRQDGFGVSDIAEALKAAFIYTENEAAVALMGTGFSAKQVFDALITAYVADYHTAIRALGDAGCDVIDLAHILKDLGLSDISVVGRLRVLEPSASEIASVLDTVFVLSATQAVRVLMHQFQLNDWAAALKSTYALSGLETAQRLWDKSCVMCVIWTLRLLAQRWRLRDLRQKTAGML